MKTTNLRETEDGEYRVQYRVDSDGGAIEVIGAQVIATGREIEAVWSRKDIKAIAEAHADAWDREMLAAKEMANAD